MTRVKRMITDLFSTSWEIISAYPSSANKIAVQKICVNLPNPCHPCAIPDKIILSFC